MVTTANYPKAESQKRKSDLADEVSDLLPADTEHSPLTVLLKQYLSQEEIEQVWVAYRYAEKAHRGQTRKTGEPYITHPVSVACILAKLHLDVPTLLAALLHDVVEDTGVASVEIGEVFGKQVAELVDGLTKLDKVELQTATQAQAENFRKMLLAMSQDVRVILVKLADRLHNMQTLEAMKPEKKKRIARETLDIYAPIANRLGLNPIFQELEDLSFKYLYPTRHHVIDKAVKAARGNRKEVITKILGAIQDQLNDAKIDAEVIGREKHLYSIYQKMTGKTVKLSQVNDIYGFRIIVKDTPSCYLALGSLHALYKPIPGRFKDYIAIPKVNGYQSLHTTLFGPFGTPIEVQIRSQEMHNIADAGVAAHWLYKTTDAHLTKLQQQTHQWLQRLVEIQTESEDSYEFLEHFKVDLFPDEVYVFTPKGKILALPKGSSAVDFAYAVHSDVGNSCVAVKINNELAPLRTEMRNGDNVEIITAPLAKPNPAWLNYVVTGKARSHIRHYLKTIKVEESAHLGERMLNIALRALHVEPSEITDKHWQKVMRDYGAQTKEAILTDIGLGKRVGLMVAHQLLANSTDVIETQKEKTNKPLDTITIRGTEGMAVQFAQCCRPIPGDPILGFINKDKGLVIHTHDCPAIRKFKLDPDKWLDVDWDADNKKLFKVNLRVVVANQRGMLAKIATTIANAESNIDNVSVEESDGSQYTNVNFTVQVHNRVHLAELIRNLRKIPDVARINRVKGTHAEQKNLALSSHLSAPPTPSTLATLKGFTPALVSHLAKLGLHTLQDLILHLPLRYLDETRITAVRDLRVGDEVQVQGEIVHAEVSYKPRKALIARLQDDSGQLTLRFLHFYPSQINALKEGARLRVYGEVRHGFFGYEMVHPQCKVWREDAPINAQLTPVYPTTAGLAQASIRKAVTLAIQQDGLHETLPVWVYASQQLPSFSESVRTLHQPAPEISLEVLQARTHPAWQRLALDELLAQQLSMRKHYAKRRSMDAPSVAASKHLVPALLKHLAFQLTHAQTKVVAEIAQDLAQPHPMQRLLQGDVGSGKTIVACIAALQAIEHGWQVALMAPTEILAEQHFKKFSQWLAPLNIDIAWLTGSQSKKERTEALQLIADGSAPMVVGTHALFQEAVQFKRLGLAIVDEQHRFGVQQRLALRQKGQPEPHQLMMSATPIPRTLSMSYYADLDVSVIDELPPGRTPIVTKLVSDQRREEILQRVRDACQAGQQAYWVCPLIEESEALQLQTANDTYAYMQAQFPELKIGLVHGRMKPAEKQQVMQGFSAHETQLLVATTVIEVGVDVPNASLMVIEHAERFGLSQLHQLRGRVGRGATKSTCILLYQNKLSETARARLKVIYEHTDGFLIAQADLHLRGPGEFLGTRQSGVPMLKIADLERDEALLEQAKVIAERLLIESSEAVDKHLARWMYQVEELVKV